MEEKEYEITKLSFDGRGIAARKQGELVTFVEGALPGEKVLARLVAVKKNFSEAICTKLLSEAQDAVQAPCPHAGSCGGCAFMRMPYSTQQFWKRQFVEDSLTRIGGLHDFDLRPLIPSPLLTGLRNKLVLSFGYTREGKFCLGMRQKASHRVEPVPSCVIGEDLAARCIPLLAERIEAKGLSCYVLDESSRASRNTHRAKASGFLRACTLRVGRIPGQNKRAVWLIFLTNEGSREEKKSISLLAEELLEYCPDIYAVVHEIRTSKDYLSSGEERVFAYGREGQDRACSRLLAPLLGKEYEMDCTDFWQVNTEASQSLALLASQAIGEGDLLDLYCGVGAPGLCCIKEGSVFGIEYSKSSVASALENARRFGVKAEYIAGDVERKIVGLSRHAKCRQVLCDPPRAGIAQPVLQHLIRLAPERIVYISCNPATLARDARLLSTAYRLDSVTPVDLFPHTPHIETVSVWRRH